MKCGYKHHVNTNAKVNVGICAHACKYVRTCGICTFMNASVYTKNMCMHAHTYVCVCVVRSVDMSVGKYVGV